MMRKLLFTFIIITLGVTGLCAAGSSEPGRVFSCISSTVRNSGADYSRIAALSRELSADSSEAARDMLETVFERASSCDDERVTCAVAVFIGVYYINHSKYENALAYLHTAYGYSHQAQERDYIDYLKSACYSGMGRIDLVAPYLENILSYDYASSSRFSQLLYCDALRIMSSYYENINKDHIALRLLNEYCLISDTLTCGSVAQCHYILPEILRCKYFDRSAGLYYGEGVHKCEQQGSSRVPLTLALTASLGMIGIGVKLLRTRFKRKNHDEALDDAHSEPAPVISLLKDTSNAISVVEPDGRLMWVNKSFEKLYGYTRDEFILTFGNNAFVTTKIDGRYEAFDKSMASKKSQSAMSKVRTGHNSEIWVLTTVTPIIEDGEIMKYVVEEVDISNLKNETKAVGIINSQLQASLRNASEIQRMLMPSKLTINKFFDNFIIYSPKDFVSGDFYWYHEIEDSHYFAVGDCTGHGPSASLLSVLSTKSLDEIILTRQILDPKEILNALDEIIIATFRKKGAVNCDGLDITICKITPVADGAHVTVAGAQSYFIYHTGNETVLLKGAKRSIGGIIDFQLKHQFENHEIELPRGSRIYMTSDGIIDQNNNARRSLGSKRFRDIIHESASLPISEQQEYLEAAAKYWAEGEPQRDDICVLALQI